MKGDDHNMTYNHIELMLDITKGVSGRSVNLPGKVIATKSYDNLLVFKSDSDFLPCPFSNHPTVITTPGTTKTERWKIVASLKPRNCSSERNDSKKNMSTFLNKNLMKEPLWVRSRNPGDAFQPSGMKNTKKLQDFMVDSKIPRIDRDSVPLIVSNKGIAAVVGWRVAEWAVPSKSEDCLYIEFDS
jgi:tRNA(Ile)-lysidine synthase